MFKKAEYPNKYKKYSRIRSFALLSLLLSVCSTGCSNGLTSSNMSKDSSPVSSTHEDSAITIESAKDAHVDFSLIKKENPDIFGWIYVPDTTSDYPVVQHSQTDDFYANHNVYGEEDHTGAVYIELANLTDMSDFNTVLHGNNSLDGTAPFADLYLFADPVFFEEHENLYLYLDGNALTYEIFAAYERENTSLLRTYDFTYLAGGQQFLDDLYHTRDMSRNLREGWDFLTPYHFLITLTTPSTNDEGKQFVVVAVLIHDAAGTVERIIHE